MRPFLAAILAAITLFAQVVTQPPGGGGGGSVGPTGATGATGATAFSTVFTSMPSWTVSSADSGVSLGFIGTSAPTVTLIAPLGGNFAARYCNGTTQPLTIAASGHAYQTSTSGGTTTSNYVLPSPPSASSCVTLTTDGTTWLLTPYGVGAAGATGATGTTGATGATGATGSANFSTPGTSHTFSGTADIFTCTGTCTITVPPPVAGVQYCVLNDDNVSSVITMSAIGSSARYENTARTAYGTAGTGTFVSGGAVGDAACLVGRDSTHYLTVSFNGAWTAS